MDVFDASETGDRAALDRALKLRLATAMDAARHPRDVDAVARGLLSLVKAELRPPSPVPPPRRPKFTPVPDPE